MRRYFALPGWFVYNCNIWYRRFWKRFMKWKEEKRGPASDLTALWIGENPLESMEITWHETILNARRIRAKECQRTEPYCIFCPTHSEVCHCSVYLSHFQHTIALSPLQHRPAAPSPINSSPSALTWSDYQRSFLGPYIPGGCQHDFPWGTIPFVCYLLSICLGNGSPVC